MGQRSQIFITFNKVKYSYHNQWCYGKGFLTTVYNLLEVISDKDFEYRKDKMTRFSFDGEGRGTVNFARPDELAILGVINFRPTNYSGFMGWSFTDDNPQQQDNNDGQAFIDFDEKTVRILGGGLEDGGALTPEQYLEEYYSSFEKEELDVVMLLNNSILQNNFKLLL